MNNRGLEPHKERPVETQSLKCTLTEQQLAERRDSLAENVRKHAELELEKKSEAARMKDQIDSLEEEMSQTAREIRDRAEWREVEVKRDKDFKRGVEEVIRLDTGEVVSTRVLAPHERQGELAILKPEAAEETAG